MANNYQNFNIRNFNSPNVPVSGNNAYSMNNKPTNAQPVSNPQINNSNNTELNAEQNNAYDAEYQVDNPSHTRLNALDSTILEAGAYQNIDDEVFKDYKELEDYLVVTDFYEDRLTIDHAKGVVKKLIKKEEM